MRVCQDTFTYINALDQLTTGSNLDASANCAKCKPNWYPAPSSLNRAFSLFNNTSIEPCTIFCDHNALNNASCPPAVVSIHSMVRRLCPEVQLLLWEWVLHGRRTCDCASLSTRIPTGFLPPHCDSSCNGEQKREHICNGHGTCAVNLVDTNEGSCVCDVGWFGAGCQHGPTLENQHFWYKDENGNVQNRTCNNGTAKTVSHYQLVLGANSEYEFANQSCTTRVGQGANETKSEFHCCFGNDYDHLTSAQKNRMFHEWGCANALKEANVFCDTDGAVDNIQEGVVFYSGTCKAVVCDCSTVYGHALSDLSGPGCQLTGCGTSSFVTIVDGEEQIQTSVCGRYPPDNAKDSCIRGKCSAISPNHNGMTRANPAPLGVKASKGYCSCNRAPDRQSTFCATGTSTPPDWVYNCCGQDEGGMAFTGTGCGKYCVCNNELTGSCATSSEQAGGVKGTSCFCLENKKGQKLFCGETCAVQCKGTVASKLSPVTRNVETIRGVALTSAEPYCKALASTSKSSRLPSLFGSGTAQNNSSPTPAPGYAILAQDPDCFADVYPCNAHGDCAAPVTGECFDTDGTCRCFGALVPIGGPGSVIADSVFDVNPVLYAGEDCATECPSIRSNDNTSVFEFYSTNKDILQSSVESLQSSVESLSGDVTLIQQRTNALHTYYNKYKSQICNGHGYCAQSSNPNVMCRCYGGYGGIACQEQCSIPQINSNSYGISYTQVDIVRISDRYRLQPCGARKRCTAEESEAFLAQLRLSILQLLPLGQRTVLAFAVWPHMTLQPSNGPSCTLALVEAGLVTNRLV